MWKNKLRSCVIKNVRCYYTVKSTKPELQENAVCKHIHSAIKATGPMTVAAYMKQVLTHPMGGYYMHKDVFGAEGDFVTSPELGQVFGEMVAIWFLNEWSKIGAPSPVQLVEFGPGRGTLCQDILRVFKHFGATKELTVQLIEVSPVLSDLQSRKLCLRSGPVQDESSLFYREGIGFDGTQVKWYKTLRDVPKGFSLFLAHEFFDALPIHKFRRTERGMRELLVDIDPDNENTFRFVLANDETPTSKLFCRDLPDGREHFEISPESLVLIEEIAQRTTEDGGLGLIVDYGHDGEDKDTFRAFKKHRLHDPLVDPGTADLTADVDFGMLKQVALKNGGVMSLGPIRQRDFLLRMGIEHRIEKLTGFLSPEQSDTLTGNYRMLIDEDKMGSRFKFLALLPNSVAELLRKSPVAGFN